MNSALPNFLEPNEQVISEFATRNHSDPHHHNGDAGFIEITNRRVLFFCEKNILKRLFKSNEPAYDLTFVVYFPQIVDISNGGIIDRYLQINGRRFYTQNADPGIITNLIKKVMNNPQAVLAVPASIPPVSGQFKNVPVPNNPIPQPNLNLGHNNYCAFCGKEMAPNALFCTGCGSKKQ